MNLLDADEVAEILRVSRRYVLRLAREGAIERIKPDGRKTVLFSEDAVRAYVEAGRRPATRPGASAARMEPEIDGVAQFRPRARRRFR